jgi:Abortive infection alpha
VDLRGERRVSAGYEERPGTDAGDDPGVEGLARLAASTWWHTAEWTVRTSAKASRRLVEAAFVPGRGAGLIEDAREVAREYAHGLADIVGLDNRSDRAARGSGPDQTQEEEWAELRAHAAEILRRSRDVHYEEPAHPAYERILGQLAPDEARILRLMLFEGPQPAIDVRTGGPIGLVNSRLIAPGFSMIGARAGCRYPDRVPGYLNNLYRLGMIWFSRETLHDPVRYQVLEAQPEVLGAVKSVRFAKIIRRSIHLTPFGEDFCRIALALDAGTLDDLPEHGAPEENRAAPDSPL